MIQASSEVYDRLEKIRNDPWEFLTKCVKTQDQVDKDNPIKPFPAHFTYLKYYVRLWQKQRKIAVPKSRRMFMSWCNIGLHIWDTMWHEGRATAFVCKKEDDSDELVRRAKFILENLTDVLPKELIPRWEYKFCKITFPELNSFIQGFPQGADQLRQFTFSAILGDEISFWPDAQLFYSAAYPTLEGGGKITLVSSPGPGFFKSLVFDQLDIANDSGE